MARRMGFKRRRRTSEEAQAAILDVAEQQLLAHGPAGLRLQEIAREIGISHPAILHHFGSREGLVKAVVERTLARIEAEVVGTLAKGTVNLETAYQTLDAVVRSLSDKGAARFMAWLILSRQGAPDPIGYGSKLRLIAELIHQRRTAEAGGVEPASFDDTLFTVLLAGLALFGAAVAGDALNASAGLPTDDASRARFLRWLSELLHNHLSPDEAAARASDSAPAG